MKSRQRAALCVAAMFLAALAGGCKPETRPMTDEEAKRVAEFTAEPTPRCVGRYVINLPRAFVLNSEASAKVEGVTVRVTPMTRGVYDMLFEARQTVLGREMLAGSKPPRPSMRKTFQLSNDEVGAVFDRAKEWASGSSLSRTLELIAWRSGFRIDAQIDATDGSDIEVDPATIGTPFEASERNTVERYRSVNDVPEKLALLLRIFDRMRGLAPGEIPNEPGICIANGFIKGAPSDKETVFVPFHLNGARDVFFGVLTQTEVREDESLLQRSAQVEREMKASGTETIRKGAKKINDVPFDEWLVRGPTPNNVPGTMATVVAHETVRDAAKPVLRVQLFNGFSVPVPSDLTDEEKRKRGLYATLERASLTEAEVIGIWDAVTPTIRLR